MLAILTVAAYPALYIAPAVMLMHAPGSSSQKSQFYSTPGVFYYFLVVFPYLLTLPDMSICSDSRTILDLVYAVL
jgi:hypothetical protein